ncbi:uncharacterized protein [Gossypium hirsutum]|uniref:Uncharacterized protein isoform X1 n=1 Tax=Gossypium hirsutum TaxID=3635 RepID=A0ABM3BDJ4_GOSHI|nr:uncharacterized protein LOC107937271 isoform X1 [Gossypium hirsutum]
MQGNSRITGKMEPLDSSFGHSNSARMQANQRDLQGHVWGRFDNSGKNLAFEISLVFPPKLAQLCPFGCFILMNVTPLLLVKLFCKIMILIIRLWWKSLWEENQVILRSLNKPIYRNIKRSWIRISSISSLPILTRRFWLHYPHHTRHTRQMSTNIQRNVMRGGFMRQGKEVQAPLMKSITDVNSGEFEDALKKVVKCICNPPNYYVKILFASIKGMTADRGAITRVMVSRSETEMDEIQRVFKEKYGIELRETICNSIPSGDYRDFLLALANKTV